MSEKSCNTWYVASCEGKNNNGTYKMDHFITVKTGDNLKWKHPLKPDFIDLYPASIVECHVEGEWDISTQEP